MCPITHASHLALLLSVVASFAFGFMWYGPVFGKVWAELMGKKMENCKGKKPPASAMLLTLFGTMLTVFAVAYIMGNTKFVCSSGGAFLIWMGFYLPLLFGTVTWEGRPWKLFALNAAYYLVNLQLIAAIVTYVR